MDNTMTDRPNILCIIDDQHRADYFSYAGARFVNTPNIDSLAAGGTVYDRCYCSYPICGPSRISLATGKNALRFGPAINPYLPLSMPTFYQRFRDRGYRVGCVGKIDLAKPDKHNGERGDRPCVFSYGFTHPCECEGKLHAAEAPEGEVYGPYGAYLRDKGKLETFRSDYESRRIAGGLHQADHDSVLATEDHEDAFIGRTTCSWIRTIPTDRPWYLLASFVGPHDPFDPPAEYAAKYRDKQVPAPIPASGSKPRSLAARRFIENDTDISTTRRQYCASIEFIDSQIGAILDTLEQTGQSENTIVVYTSDHGEMLGDQNTFLKAILYEPAIRVPLVIRTPRQCRNQAGPHTPGRHTNALVELLDLNQTLLEMCGLPCLQDTDSRSFAAVEQCGTNVHRDFITVANHDSTCIRTDRYKLIQNIGDIPELYDMETDPMETSNIAECQPEIVKQLGRTLYEAPYDVAWNI